MKFLIPPKTLRSRDGSFRFADTESVASIHSEDRIPILGLIDTLSAAGVQARLSMSGGRIRLVRKKAVTHPEGYRLTIRPDDIEIAASTSAGAYYGVQTLREIVVAEGRTVPCVEIADEPVFSRRAFYLDCSRGRVPTVDTVRRLTERLARFKMNELQLYIENVYTFASHPAIGEGFSPYTPEDIIAMREHCRLHHVEFVPSLTSLGHFEKILMLPEYQELGELPGFRDFPGGTTLNPQNPRSARLVRDMCDDFLPLFDVDDFNACGDEPWELGQGRSKNRADEVGLGRVYLDHMLKLRELSVAHGMRMNMWGDIVLKHPDIIPSIPRDVVLLNWDYKPDGERMRRTDEFSAVGLSLVCCPGTHGWQSHGTRLRMSMRNIHQFAQIAADHDAEGVLNTDWGDGGHRNTLGVSLHGAAYGAACSWNPAAAPSPEEDEFTRSFVLQVFGDRDGALVDVIKTIGDDDYGYWAYHALIESLREPRSFGWGYGQARTMIESVDVDDAALAAKIGAAPELRVPEAGESEDEFEGTTRKEFALAHAMNVAAARRVLIARRIRSGETADAGSIAEHRKELQEIRETFSDLWRIRSRRSRLEDNLAGFDEAVSELEDLG